MKQSQGLAAGEPRSASRHARGERGIWQRCYWEQTIWNDRDCATHVDCIHFDPVKHGLVAEAGAWPFSSFQRCVALGLYPPASAGEDHRVHNRGERQ